MFRLNLAYLVGTSQELAHILTFFFFTSICDVRSARISLNILLRLRRKGLILVAMVQEGCAGSYGSHMRSHTLCLAAVQHALILG